MLEEPLLPEVTGQAQGNRGCDTPSKHPRCDISLGAHDALLRGAAVKWGKKLASSVQPPMCYITFDATFSRTKRLYEALASSDENGQEHGKADSTDLRLFRKALEVEHFELGASDEKLLKEVFLIVSQGKQTLSVQQLHVGLQRLKLLFLLQPNLEEGLFAESYGWQIEWSPGKFRGDVVAPRNAPQLLLAPRQSWGTMQWTHLEDPDELTLLRSGVRHQLHLSALDKYKGRHMQAHLLSRGCDQNLMIPVVRLTKASKAMLGEYGEEQKDMRQSGKYKTVVLSGVQKRVVVEMEEALLCIFLPGNFDEVFSFCSSWHRPGSHDSPRGHHHSRGLCRHAEDRTNIANQENDYEPSALSYLHKTMKDTRLFETLTEHLERDYSELRVGDARWLLCAMLHKVVDSSIMVQDALWARYGWFEHNLDEHADAELVRMQRDMQRVMWKAEQLVNVIRRLIKSVDWENDVSCYLHSIEDDAAQLANRITSAINTCEKLRDEVRSQRECKESHAAYKITLMVTLLWPLQFLTGVYGMNFQDAAGKGVIPILGSLTLERSYAMFWGLGIGLMALSAVWFRSAGLL